jgi:hypothetical protein
LTYRIIEDYGSDIDPVYTKDMDIDFDHNQSVKLVSIRERKK